MRRERGRERERERERERGREREREREGERKFNDILENEGHRRKGYYTSSIYHIVL